MSKRNIWQKATNDAFNQVAKDNPVTKDTPTRVNSEGKVVNMSRKAMMDRVNTLDTVFFGVITGEITND